VLVGDDELIDYDDEHRRRHGDYGAG